ncbi:MAG: tetratricopeptide repeat protein [Candidatus Portnoybacteria bacterium]|jgi:hypothetical protein|nr:tetratricopeptide repeat protein [Candidatus Portnoybacteria bacterium]
MKFSAKVVVPIVLVLFIITGSLYYFYYYRNQMNFLIPGIPYYGFYNQFFDANSSELSTVASILGYWDKKVNPSDLFEEFAEIDSSASGRYSQIQSLVLYPSQITVFFQKKGYETRFYSPAVDSEIDKISEIKKFVNPQKKTPVIIYQRRSADAERISNGFRIIIGVFDKEKKIIVHDYDFGNNYEISYEDFEKMFDLTNNWAILAVWPGEELTAEIKGPDYSRTYPKRLEAMDNVGEILIKSNDIVWFNNNQKYEQALNLFKEIIADPKFEYLPPAHRVSFFTSFANLYLRADRADEAIKILNEKALPLNHDLSQSYGDWNKPLNIDKFSTPYYVLGTAYQKKGDKESARQNFEEALKIKPDNKEVQDALKQLE